VFCAKCFSTTTHQQLSTGEYYGPANQAIAALCPLGACVLVYTGLSLSTRRLTAELKRKQLSLSASNAVEKNELNEIAVEL
jgi:hypothetical protein